MALRRYFSFSSSQPPASSVFPANARLNELRRFWKTTIEELLSKGDKYRSAAINRLSTYQELMSGADMWDLQTMYDGLVVERDDLAEFFHAPEKLSFDVVSRASRYKSRAKSLYGEVNEVVRRSQASIEIARVSALNAEQESHASQPAKPFAHSCRDLDSSYDRWLVRNQSQCDSINNVPELCHSPSTIASSPIGCAYDKLPSTAPAIEESPYSAGLPLQSPWDTVSTETDGIDPDKDSPPRVHETLHHCVLCFQSLDQCTACHVAPNAPPPVCPNLDHRGSTHSDFWGSSDSSSSPRTPHSTPHSAHPSVNLSTAPSFLSRLDDALKGLDTSIDVSELELMLSTQSSKQNSTKERSASRVLRREGTYPSYFPKEVSSTLPFRPPSDLRRIATQPDLRRRQRQPILLTKEALEQLGSVTSALKSPLRDAQPENAQDEDDVGDLFNDDCTVEVASVVVQPYGHSRSNTKDSVDFPGYL